MAENELEKLMQRAMIACMKCPEPEYMFINNEVYDAMKKENEHHNKWRKELFSPKGLSILFKER